VLNARAPISPTITAAAAKTAVPVSVLAQEDCDDELDELDELVPTSDDDFFMIFPFVMIYEQRAYAVGIVAPKYPSSRQPRYHDPPSIGKTLGRRLCVLAFKQDCPNTVLS
jgi:hypothetical protein